MYDVRSFAALLSVTLSGAALVAVPAAAVSAEPPLCQGVPATVVADPSNGKAVGTAGDDVIWAGDLTDVRIYAGGGDDLICGATGSTRIRPGAGDDTMVVPSGWVRVQASTGDDSVTAPPDPRSQLWFTDGPSPVRIDVAEGTATTPESTLKFSGFAQFTGTRGDDTFLGSPADEIFRGANGTDVVRTGAGDDEVYVADGSRVRLGPGDDVANAGNGASINGGPGNDHLVGHLTRRPHGAFRLSGGPGNDRIDVGSQGKGNAWSGSVVGGPGRDAIGFGVGTGVTVDLGRHRVQWPYARGTVAGVENVVGSVGDDLIVGDGRNNLLRGSYGDDVIRGMGGRDRANGGPGNDRCEAEIRVSC